MDARSWYLKYKLIVVVFRCPINEETGELAISKKKSEAGSRSKGPFEFLNLNISLLNGRQVLIFEI